MFPMSTTQGNPRGKYIYSNATYKVTLEYLVILQTLLRPFARREPLATNGLPSLVYTSNRQSHEIKTMQYLIFWYLIAP